MNAWLTRWMGVVVVLACVALFFPSLCSWMGVLWGSLMLTVLYELLRPLLQTLILPLNAFVWGLLSPLTDALFVWWTTGWVAGLSVGYWQSVCVALCISIAYYPYSAHKKKKLCMNQQKTPL